MRFRHLTASVATNRTNTAELASKTNISTAELAETTKKTQGHRCNDRRNSKDSDGGLGPQDLALPLSRLFCWFIFGLRFPVAAAQQQHNTGQRGGRPRTLFSSFSLRSCHASTHSKYVECDSGSAHKIRKVRIWTHSPKSAAPFALPSRNATADFGPLSCLTEDCHPEKLSCR